MHSFKKGFNLFFNGLLFLLCGPKNPPNPRSNTCTPTPTITKFLSFIPSHQFQLNPDQIETIQRNRGNKIQFHFYTMKRRREKKETELKEAIEELSLLQHPKLIVKPPPLVADPAGAPAPASADHTLLPQVSCIPARPFLSLCNLVLQFLDKIGPAMSVLRQDMSHNIQRLELRLDSDPKTKSNVIEILKHEADEGIARKRDSCSRALLWLTRSLDLMVALLERIAKDPSQSMEKVVEDSYSFTLKPWHGWISFAAYKVALKLLPDNKTFIDLLVAKGENMSTLKEEIQSLTALLVPLLDDIHFVMRIYGVDELKCA